MNNIISHKLYIIGRVRTKRYHIDSIDFSSKIIVKNFQNCEFGKLHVELASFLFRTSYSLFDIILINYYKLFNS